jgi:hypothetical protein
VNSASRMTASNIVSVCRYSPAGVLVGTRKVDCRIFGFDRHQHDRSRCNFPSSDIHQLDTLQVSFIRRTSIRHVASFFHPLFHRGCPRPVQPVRFIVLLFRIPLFHKPFHAFMLIWGTVSTPATHTFVSPAGDWTGIQFPVGPSNVTGRGCAVDSVSAHPSS